MRWTMWSHFDNLIGHWFVNSLSDDIWLFVYWLTDWHSLYLSLPYPLILSFFECSVFTVYHFNWPHHTVYWLPDHQMRWCCGWEYWLIAEFSIFKIEWLFFSLYLCARVHPFSPFLIARRLQLSSQWMCAQNVKWNASSSFVIPFVHKLIV